METFISIDTYQLFEMPSDPIIKKIINESARICIKIILSSILLVVYITAISAVEKYYILSMPDGDYFINLMFELKGFGALALFIGSTVYQLEQNYQAITHLTQILSRIKEYIGL